VAEGSAGQLVARELVRVQDVLYGEGQAFGGRIPLAGGTRRGGTWVRRGIAVHRSRQVNRADLLETVNGLGTS